MNFSKGKEENEMSPFGIIMTGVITLHAIMLGLLIWAWFRRRNEFSNTHGPSDKKVRSRIVALFPRRTPVRPLLKFTKTLRDYMLISSVNFTSG